MSTTTTLPIQVESHHPTTLPPHILPLLQSPLYFPHTLPVLRRIQFARNFAEKGGATATSCVVHVHNNNNNNNNHDQVVHFATAYVDLSRAPETQVWLFCSLEPKVQKGTSLADMSVSLEEGEERVHDGLLLRLFQHIDGLAKGRRNRKILVGSVHEMVRRQMMGMGMGLEKTEVAGRQEWEWDYKFLFDATDLGELDGGMERGRWVREGREFYWDRVREEDVRLVKSRTGIDRQEKTLLMVPSVAVRLGETGEAVGWAFLGEWGVVCEGGGEWGADCWVEGLDGTIMTLHVEEPYRRLGLGKAIAIKLMREYLDEYATDGYGAADVWIENTKSQGLCHAIGGRPSWIVSWGLLDLESIRNIKL
ncbi:hypothetical protein QBC40DRAFT_221883 [Triangularia verruculosa]|uniref:N-acetyltransferase domain-containing protein n=1 Tax=Triangularia verruculosa TaxID=2587418 RepID=A0AAN7AYV4_9PEZI|nr:hypothetical protein QBC40DRAFT_221883 [Triangularia verruculosa]